MADNTIIYVALSLASTIIGYLISRLKFSLKNKEIDNSKEYTVNEQLMKVIDQFGNIISKNESRLKEIEEIHSKAINGYADSLSQLEKEINQSKNMITELFIMSKIVKEKLKAIADYTTDESCKIKVLDVREFICSYTQKLDRRED